MDAVFDFLWPTWSLLCEYSTLPLRSATGFVDDVDWVSQFGGRGPHSDDFHNAIYISDAQHGRPSILDSRYLAGAPRPDLVGEVVVCRDHVDYPLFTTDFTERFYVADRSADALDRIGAPSDLLVYLYGAFRNRRGSRGDLP